MRSPFSAVGRRLAAVARYELSAPVNLAVVLITGGVFAAQKYYAGKLFVVDRVWADLGFVRRLIVDGKQPWRLITPNLIHTASWWRPAGRLSWIGTVGLLHLVAVLLALMLFGPLVERTFGHRRFAVIYVVCGLAAYALLLVRRPGPFLQGGASGAVYGVFAAFLILVARHRHEHGYRHLIRPAIVMFAIMAGAQYGWNADAPRLLHVGGFAAGIVLGVALDPRPPIAAGSRPATDVGTVSSQAL